MSQTMIDAIARHTASCEAQADALIAQGPMTFNRVTERLLRARMERTGDPTNIIACAMRAIRGAEISATEQECRDIVLEELEAAQHRISARLREAAVRRNAAGGPFPISEEAASA